MQRQNRALQSSRYLAGLMAALLGAFVLLASAQDAEARPRPRSSSFTANKTFGMGLILGGPTGLSGKYFLSSDTAIDFGLGVYRGFRARDGLHVHADFLWHPASLINAQPFVMPLYVGIGGHIFDYDDDDRYDDDVAIGVRVPLGIAFDFNNVPLDIFIELAFILDFVNRDVDDDLEAYLDGAVGIRYYFF